MKNMFQALQFETAMIAIFVLLFAEAWFNATTVRDLSDVLLKLKGYGRFFFFDDEVRGNFFKECLRHATSYNPSVERSMGWFSAFSSYLEVSSEHYGYFSDGSWIGHVDTDVKLVANVGTRRQYAPLNNDPTLTVKESSDVAYVHVPSFTEVPNEKMAKSGKSQCPVLVNAEGQSRTKQRAEVLSGVRNEHVPSTKVKMCSGLHGNMQSAAEMTAPCTGTSIPYIVTKAEYEVHTILDHDLSKVPIRFYRLEGVREHR